MIKLLDASKGDAYVLKPRQTTIRVGNVTLHTVAFLVDTSDGLTGAGHFYDPVYSTVFQIFCGKFATSDPRSLEAHLVGTDFRGKRSDIAYSGKYSLMELERLGFSSDRIRLKGLEPAAVYVVEFDRNLRKVSAHANGQVI